MSKVSVTKIKLDYLANTISAKSGVAAPLTLDQMAVAVRSIPTGGGSGITIPSGAAYVRISTLRQPDSTICSLIRTA